MLMSGAKLEPTTSLFQTKYPCFTDVYRLNKVLKPFMVLDCIKKWAWCPNRVTSYRVLSISGSIAVILS